MVCREIPATRRKTQILDAFPQAMRMGEDAKGEPGRGNHQRLPSETIGLASRARLAPTSRKRWSLAKRVSSCVPRRARNSRANSRAGQG